MDPDLHNRTPVESPDAGHENTDQIQRTNELARAEDPGACHTRATRQGVQR
jgi:hypothetical protein